MRKTIKNFTAYFFCLAAILFTISYSTAQNISKRNYNDATGFVFGDIKFNMEYSAARLFLVNAPDTYTEKDRTFISIGKFGVKFWDMPIDEKVEMGFYNKKLNRLIFKIDAANLNTDRITKEFNKQPETLSDKWSYWVNGNYVLDITTDSITHIKRVQLEYMGF
jgi:hypothetical protein